VSGPAIAAPPPAGPATLSWAACGDSFTAGTEPGRGWADLVASELAIAGPIELHNLAVAGAALAEIESEQLPRAIAAAPDLLTLIGGGNDVIATVRPRTDSIAADLERILGRVVTELPATAVMTATYPPISADALRPRTRRRIRSGMEALNEAIRTAADRLEITCIELHEHPGRADRSNYAADGIHPSPAGREAAAAVLGPVVGQLLGTIGRSR